MIILWYIFIALIPGIFWLWFFRQRDKQDPEPLKLIIQVFIWGMAATIPAIALEFAVEFFIPYAASKNYLAIVLSSFLIVAPIEEFLKYAVVRWKVYNNKAFNEPLDGIIYCVTAGLGFATMENFLVTISEGGTSVILRFATATLMHAVTSGIVGYYMGIAKFQPSKKHSIAKGLFFAIFLHGLYNSVASLNAPITIFLLVILLVAMYLILAKSIREIKKVHYSIKN